MRSIVLVLMIILVLNAAAWASGASGVSGASGGAEPEASDAPQPWDKWLDAVAANPRLADARAAFVKQALVMAKRPIYERVYHFEDVGKKGRSWLDGRNVGVSDEARETFVLAMSDSSCSAGLLDELPTLAAAYRLSRDPVLLERCLAQLRETSGWSPLQRPGWTLLGPTSKRFTDPKGDGNWLATGNSILAIVESLQMLPHESVPADLRARLDALLETEIANCVDDWKVRRPWYYKYPNPLTNQWVLPTAGYLLASSYLGREKHRAAYDLGVEHLMMTLDGCGPEGAQSEGVGYGSFTMGILFRTARWLAADGDGRLLAHPFFKNFPTWIVHHMQPGGYTINCFDQGGGPKVAVRDGKRVGNGGTLMALFAMTGNLDARWAVHRAVTGGGAANWGFLLSEGSPPPPDGYEPTLWHLYDRTRRVNWRSSWNEDTASGVWVRGCHPKDQHAHADHGHVNFICHGRAILIEAGSCLYHCPVGTSNFSSAFGHNVMYLGTFTPAQCDARASKGFPPGFPDRGGDVPITVARLDARGGDVTVDPTSSYKAVHCKWTRHVVWDTEQLRVEDQVDPAEAQIINFRWHLGTTVMPVISGSGGGKAWQVTWEGAEMHIDSDVPLLITSEPMCDNTLGTRPADEHANYPTHACLVVRTAEAQAHAKMTMQVQGTAVK